MFGKSLALVLSAGLVSASFASSNIFHKFQAMQKDTIRQEVSSQSKNSQPSSYTDFSGTWNGTCSMDNKAPSPLQFVIENDAHYIAIDGENFDIGSLKTESFASEEGLNVDHFDLNWNSDGSMLIVKSVGINKEFIKSNNGNSLLYTFLSKLTLALNAGKLVIQGEMSGMQDLSQEKTHHMSCTLSKVMKM